MVDIPSMRCYEAANYFLKIYNGILSRDRGGSNPAWVGKPYVALPVSKISGEIAYENMAGYPDKFTDSDSYCKHLDDLYRERVAQWERLHPKNPNQLEINKFISRASRQGEVKA